MKTKTEIPLKFLLYLTGFIAIVLTIGFSDYLFSKLAYLIAEKQNFVILALSGIIIAMVVIKTYIGIKNLFK